MANGYTGFGYWRACPPFVAIAWGARAILNRGTLDIPWDRQDWNGTGKDDKLVRKSFAKLLNRCLPRFEDEVLRLHKEGKLRSDEAEEFTFTHAGVKFTFNTNGSCGYLYVLAHME
jgi:hypothetical protein